MSVEGSTFGVEPRNGGAPRGAVFLSYASQDAEAAQRICDALRAAGVEVWFDQEALRGGDSWDQKIRRQIQSCALFVPIISANTQARAEGYFRLEWKLAVDRSHLMADDAPFLFPVVVDETTDAEARVPDRFREVQWTQCLGGNVPRELARRVLKLLEGEETVEVSPKGNERRRRRGMRWNWTLIFPIVGTVIGLGYALLPLWKSFQSTNRNAQNNAPSTVAVSQGPASEAAGMIDRAYEILERSSLKRSEIESANLLVEKATELEPSNARAWSLAASADLAMIFPYRYDTSDAMRRRAMARASRALSLAPDDLEVQIVHANVFAHASNNPVFVKQAETLFRRLVVEHPEMHYLVIRLADVLRAAGRTKDGAQYLEENGEPVLAGWFWLESGSMDEAYRVARSPAVQASTHIDKWLLRLTIESAWLQDLNLSSKTIEEMPPAVFTGDNTTVFAILIAFCRRDPEQMLQFTSVLSRDWIESYNYAGPRQYWTGWAHKLAGRPERARIEWEAAVRLLDEALKRAPERFDFGFLKAEILALLGKKETARKVLAESQAVAGVGADNVSYENCQTWLALGENDLVLEWLDPFLRNRADFRWSFLHMQARYSPQWDGLRGNPRFEALLRGTKPESAKPFDDHQPE